MSKEVSSTEIKDLPGHWSSLLGYQHVSRATCFVRMRREHTEQDLDRGGQGAKVEYTAQAVVAGNLCKAAPRGRLSLRRYAHQGCDGVY